MYKGKVYKSYDMIASSKMLSIKIIGDSIKNEASYIVCEEVVNEGLKRDHNFEIIRMRKIKSHNYAWIVATNPKQTHNIKKI